MFDRLFKAQENTMNSSAKEVAWSGSYIEITEVIDKLFYKVVMWNFLLLKKSAVLAPRQSQAIILPYRLVGNPGTLRNVLANHNVKISSRLRTCGQLWVAVHNTSNQPQVLTPGIRIAVFYQPGVMLQLLDGSMEELYQKLRCREQYLFLTKHKGSLLTVEQLQAELTDIFDTNNMELTEHMIELRVGEDIVRIITRTPFISEGKTKPMSVAEELQILKEIQLLQAKGIMVELEVGDKGMFHQFLAFPKMSKARK